MAILDLLKKGGYLDGSAQVDGLIKAYTVAAGQTVTAGGLVDFVNGTIKPATINPAVDAGDTAVGTIVAGGGAIDVGAIDETRALILYKESAALFKAVVVAVVNGTITIGTPLTVDTGNVSCASVGKAIRNNANIPIAWGRSTGYAYTVVLGVNADNSLNALGQYVLTTTNATQNAITCITLSDTKYAVLTASNSANLHLYTVSINAAGVPTNWNGGGADIWTIAGTTLTAMASTLVPGTDKVLAFYRGETSGYLTGVVGEVHTDGTAEKLGSITTLNALDSTAIECVPIGFNTVLVTYRAGASGYLYGVVVTLNTNNTLSAGTIVQLNSENSTPYSVIQLSKTRYLVAYTVGTTVKTMLITVNGTTVTAGTVTVARSTNKAIPAMALISQNRAILVTQDTAALTAYATFVYPIKPKGMALAGGAAGAQVNVILKGYATGLSGLTPGLDYYYDNEGAITTTPTDSKIGLAVKADKLTRKAYL